MRITKKSIYIIFKTRAPKVDSAFFALPYNPYGKREDYAWSFPARWFDMKKDPVVLIGNDFWDMIGGAGTYEMFIKEINALGKEYRDRIYKEYLGIEPPADDHSIEVL